MNVLQNDKRAYLIKTAVITGTKYQQNLTLIYPLAILFDSIFIFMSERSEQDTIGLC